MVARVAVVVCPILAACVSTTPHDDGAASRMALPARTEQLTPICNGDTLAPEGFPSQVYVRSDRDQVLLVPLYRVDKADFTGAVGAPTRTFTVKKMELLVEVGGHHVEARGWPRGGGDPVTCTYLPPQIFAAYVRDHSL